MISHSPPIFSHSPPVSFLAEFMGNNTNSSYNDDNNKSRYFRPQMLKLQSRASAKPSLNGRRPSAAGHGLERIASAPEMQCPPKSCLIRRQKDAMDIHTNQCRRKNVKFADDQGLSLIEVRIMSEPSNVPPYWSMKFLEQITQGLVSPHPADTWTVDFKQPASDYLSFRQKIEKDFVSLENVIVKDDESLILGTVKVKNVSFRKEVIVRATWDDWKSQQDIFCTFSKIYSPTAAHVVFDTFSFKITLPPSPSKKLEFCICYRADDGKEYWDNNESKNYSVIKRSPFYYDALGPYDKTLGFRKFSMPPSNNYDNCDKLSTDSSTMKACSDKNNNDLKSVSPYY